MSNNPLITIHEANKPFEDTFETCFQSKYKPDNWQLYAFKAIHNKENVLATAHTGSGKTALALEAIAYWLKQGKKVIYTSPIKTLSNQKKREFSQIFPDVGIITGDIKINPGAQCLIMTAEILKNSLLRKHDNTIYDWNFNPDEVSCVIIDEAHYLNNPERGKVWEEIFLNLSPNIQLVMLSATISEPLEMVEWIANLKQVKCNLVSTKKRPVPLTNAIFWDDKLHTFLEDDTKWNHMVWNDVKKSMDKYFSKNRFSNVIFHNCLKYLENNNLLPAIVFILNRDAVENMAKTLPNFITDHLEGAKIVSIWEKELHKYKKIFEHSQEFYMVYDLVCKGIGIHHSGMIPILREIVEILYEAGLLKVLLATETFAMGVNAPTKTVVFTNLTKFDGNTKRLLRPEEYGQMAGRAGRRGLDASGMVVVMPFLDFITENEAKTIVLSPPQKITSKLALDYSLILKQLNYKIDLKNTDKPVEYLTNILSKTLFNGQESKQLISLFREKEETEKKLIQFNPSITEEVKALKDSYLRILEINEKLKPQGYFVLDRKVEKKLLNEKKDLEKTINPTNQKILDTWIPLDNKIYNLNREISYAQEKLSLHIEMILDYLNKNEMIDENCILTKKGRIVSEINECNPLIMSKIIDSNMLDDLEFPEIMGILSLFIADKDREEIFVNDLDISNKERDIIKTIFNFSTDLSNDEIKLIQKVPFPFNSEWGLSLNMVEIIRDWAKGEEWLAISHKFNNFIGNFIKNVLRLTNVARNIEAIAILLNNVSLINKLNGFQEKLIRDIVITDSLYC